MRARDNPFRIDRVHQLRFRFLQASMPELLSRIAAQQFRGAVIGPHGSGKSTLLEELSAHLKRQGESPSLIRLTTETVPRQLPLVMDWLKSSAPGQLLIFDGAEQLRSSLWKEMKEASTGFRGLLISAHRPGLLPTLYECRPAQALLCDLVTELTHDSRFHVPAEKLELLFRRHKGNLRDCLRELYDLASQFDAG